LGSILCNGISGTDQIECTRGFHYFFAGLVRGWYLHFEMVIFSCLNSWFLVCSCDGRIKVYCTDSEKQEWVYVLKDNAEESYHSKTDWQYLHFYAEAMKLMSYWSHCCLDYSALIARHNLISTVKVINNFEPHMIGFVQIPDISICFYYTLAFISRPIVETKFSIQIFCLWFMNLLQ
jgi:hypothetical protein